MLGIALAYYWRVAIGLPLSALAVFLLVRVFRRDAEREKGYKERRAVRFAAIAAPMGNAWRPLLIAEGLADWVPVVEPLVRPAVRLTTTRADELPIGRSRIGGVPDLPTSTSWPKGKKGSLPFLAQIDLAEAAPCVPDGLLPRSGYLWFFYDTIGWSGGEHSPNDGGGPIVFYEPGRPTLAPAIVPDDLHRKLRFSQCAVTMAAYEDIPDTDANEELSRLFFEEDDKGDRYYLIDEYLAGATMGNTHKLLGWASPIQGAMEMQCQQLKHGIKKNNDQRLKAHGGRRAQLEVAIAGGVGSERRDDVGRRGPPLLLDPSRRSARRAIRPGGDDHAVLLRGSPREGPRGRQLILTRASSSS